MKHALLLFLIIPFLAAGQNDKQTKPEATKPAVRDTVILQVTELQEKLLNEYDKSLQDITEKKNLLVALILDLNKKTQAQLEGKQVKIVRRKED